MNGVWSPEALAYFNTHIEQEYYMFCKQVLADSSVNVVIILVNNDQVHLEMVKRKFAQLLQ